MPIDAAAELWEAWAGGRLCLQACTSCGVFQHPPGPVCASCHGTSLHLQDIDGAADLVSWSTVHRAPAAQFAPDVPYTIAIVRVGDTALVEARVDPRMDVGGLHGGMRVRLAIGQVAARHLPFVVAP